MGCILVIFMTHYVVDAAGAPAPLTAEQSKTWFHLFVAADPFLILVLIPAFSYLIYPALNRPWRLNPPRRY